MTSPDRFIWGEGDGTMPAHFSQVYSSGTEKLDISDETIDHIDLIRKEKSLDLIFKWVNPENQENDKSEL